MKRYLFFLPMLATFFIQCETEPLDPVIDVDQMPSGDEFNATIDGSDFEYEGLATSTSSAGGATLISISAGSMSGESISVTISEDAMTGTVTLPDPNGDASLIYTNGTTPYMLDSGSVNISTLNTTDMVVSGTFSGTFVDSNGMEPDKSVSGDFDVSY